MISPHIIHVYRVVILRLEAVYPLDTLLYFRGSYSVIIKLQYSVYSEYSLPCSILNYVFTIFIQINIYIQCLIVVTSKYTKKFSSLP